MKSLSAKIERHVVLLMAFVCVQSFSQITRRYDLGLGTQYKKSQFGMNLSFDYNWILSPVSAVGLSSGFRTFGAKENQLSYGLSLSHRVIPSQEESAESLRGALFVRYGLFIRATWLQGRSGYAHAHETDLGLRYYILDRVFAGLSYNLSELHYFEVSEGAQNLLLLSLGYSF
jgi:hypothetical protein